MLRVHRSFSVFLILCFLLSSCITIQVPGRGGPTPTEISPTNPPPPTETQPPTVTADIPTPTASSAEGTNDVQPQIVVEGPKPAEEANVHLVDHFPGTINLPARNFDDDPGTSVLTGRNMAMIVRTGANRSLGSNPAIGAFLEMYGDPAETSTPPPSTGDIPLNAVTDMNLPMMNRLGHGYNVRGEYARAKAIDDDAIFDMNKLVQDHLILKQDIVETDWKQISADSARAYTHELAVRVGVSGRYLCFGGSLNTNYHSVNTSQENRSYSTIRYLVQEYGLAISDLKSPQDLIPYVRPSIQEYLLTKTPDEIFANLGTHVIRSLIAGGRFDYNLTIENQYTKSVEEFSLQTQASFNAIIYGASADFSMDTSTITEEFSQNKQETIITSGGTGVDGAFLAQNADALHQWQTEVRANPGLADFGENNPLIPIWALVNNPEKAKQIEERFYQILDLDAQNLPPDGAIVAMRIRKVTMADAASEGYQYKPFDDQQGNTWYPVGNISPHTFMDNDTMSILYVLYGSSIGPDAEPVVDIVLEDYTMGEDGYGYLQQKYQNDPTAKIWGWLDYQIPGGNNDQPLAGEISRENGAHWVLLYYVTSQDPKLPVVREVITVHKNSEWSPAPPKPGVDYQPVCDLTQLLQANECVPKDTSAGIINEQVDILWRGKVFGDTKLYYHAAARVALSGSQY